MSRRRAVEAAQALAARYGTRFVQASDDASMVTYPPLAREKAAALVAELHAAGYEATDSVDCDDPGQRWVYVTEGAYAGGVQP